MRPCRKILTIKIAWRQQGIAACLRKPKPFHISHGQIHNAEIPRGSTCLLIQAGTHTFLSHTHTHTGQQRQLMRWCEVQSGASLEQGSLFLIHGLCFPLMMGPLSVFPVDQHHSGLLIKPSFTKPKQGNKEGKREKGERRALMEVWKGKGDWTEKREELKAGMKRVVTEGRFLETGLKISGRERK